MKSAILQSISSITCDWAEKIGLFAILLNLFRLYTVKSKAASPVALGFVRNKNWTKRISCFIVVRGTGVLTTFENSFNVLTKTYNSYRIIAVVLSTLARRIVVNTPVPLTIRQPNGTHPSFNPCKCRCYDKEQFVMREFWREKTGATKSKIAKKRGATKSNFDGKQV